MNAKDGSVKVTMLVDEQVWTRTNDLNDAKSEDRVFAVDAAGTIVFGDGIHGQQPRQGARVTVSWRQGAGEEGNTQLTFSTSWPLRESAFQIASGLNGIRITPVFVCSESGSGEKRVRYFTGQMLAANDFETEQQYFIDKLRRHNRFLHGHGVVTGLEVSVVQTALSSSVVVSPGYGVSVEGAELLLTQPLELKIDARISPQYVTLRYAQVETDPVPTTDPNLSTPSRIEDRVVACLVSEEETSVGVTIGRIVSSDAGWIVDGDFTVRRPFGPV